MKKFVALLLAMLLVLANVAALAEDGGDDQIPTVPAGAGGLKAGYVTGTDTAPKFTKTYSSDKGVYPAETLTFTVTNATTNPTGTPDITVGTSNAFNVDGKKASYDIPINVPVIDDYPVGAGKYDYTIKEQPGVTQGVDYSAAAALTINVSVYIYYEKDSTTNTLVRKQKVNVYTTDETNKTDTITNTYTVGDLTVTKAVTGNLGDKTRDFTLQVDFASDGKPVLSDIKLTLSNGASVKEGETSYTEKIPYVSGTTEGWTTKTLIVTAKDTGSVKFENIPAGVTYTVKENDITNISAEAQMANINKPNAYTITYSGTGTSTAENTTGEISATATSTATVTNDKGIQIPTGIVLDSMPYILILAVAMLGVALAARKREEY